MKAKTWKKAVLFSLVTSWSVFTTGCISPAIFKAILGLVEAIFNDAGGTGAGGTPTRTGANTGLNTANNGNTGINTKGGTPTANGTQPTPPPAPTRPGATIADAGSDVNNGGTGQQGTGGGEQPDGAAAFNQDIDLARTRIDNQREVLTQAGQFLTWLPQCGAVEEDRQKEITRLGEIMPRFQVFAQRVDSINSSPASVAEKTGMLNQLNELLRTSEIELVGAADAPKLSFSREAAQKWLLDRFDRIRKDEQFTAGLFDKYWRMRMRVRSECFN